MKDIIKNAYIEVLSGIAEYHEDGGVISKNKYGEVITIAFTTSDTVVVTSYYMSGVKWYEKRYDQGLLHGKYSIWYSTGKIYADIEYHYGKFINTKYY